MATTVLQGDGVAADSAAAVRAHLGQAAGEIGMSRDLREDLALVATELVTNALRAGASGVLVALRITDEGLQVRVRDDAPGVPRRIAVHVDDVSGRGLMIVDRLAREWGCDQRADGGKVVWATLSQR